MQDGMAVLGSLTHKTVISLRNDLTALRDWVYSHESEIGCMIKKLLEQTLYQQDQVQTLVQVMLENGGQLPKLAPILY